ncbi:hypothetical protein SSABA_v1c00990 [Spiroplasma sabaudiense Ar-1343]|uniref:Transmembrane protein n=1 Tax=Spiroplasma sabaudiense Ar-1343 TaxID=1276257 RepID=W6A966_9MOLU|nr:hypothetical protein [Spiroplasma sabaudiense]AHI53511.1 hypothetical protein SSABA_v1c00990 [Spiroplasma sabaudiense Ar-1343]
MVSTKHGITSTIVGTIISLFGALIQFLTLYFVLEKFGSTFNGFVKIATAIGALIGTADGALGIATTILLVKPIAQKDWITANEIFSTARKNYRKGAKLSVTLLLLSAIFYPIWVVISSSTTDFSEFFKHFGIVLNGNSNVTFAPYWQMLCIILLFGAKNLGSGVFFGVYENIITADSENAVRRIIILFTDIIVYSIFFYLLTFDSTDPIIPFLAMLIYSPLRGCLIMIYVKRTYVWIKFYPEFNNYKLKIAAKEISQSNLGTSVLMNTDILIAAVLLGLNASSVLSLYFVIAVNIRLIMTNFITSFREFFVVLVIKNGRIYWNSYSKYEIYTYIVGAFTFINMAILSPYLVSALYGNLMDAQIANSVGENIWTNSELILYRYVFYNPTFSMIFAGITTLAILCESQINIIQAKGRFAEVTKVQNFLGFTYIVLAFAVTALFAFLRVGGDQYLVLSLMMFMLLKLFFLFIRYSYLWFYVYRYGTYNSNIKNVIQNALILIVPIAIATTIQLTVIGRVIPLNLEHLRFLPLVGLFFTTVFCSIALIFLVAIILSPKMVVGIVRRLPILGERYRRRKEKERDERLSKNNISLADVNAKGNLIVQDYISINENEIEKELENQNLGKTQTTEAKKVYKLKG